MTSAFIVQLNVPSLDSSTLAGLAEQILEAVMDDGLDALSCRPWTHPSLGTPDSLGPSPTEQVQPLF